MKIRFTHSRPHFLAASLALALGLSANAFAEPPRGEPGGPGGPGFHRHGGHHPGFGFGGMARLHDELKLDAKQEALWQDADKFAKDSFSGGRERFQKHHEEIAAALNQPGADLRAIVKRMDEFRAEGQKQRDAVRDRWLSVYDALNADQKEKARLFFKTRADRPERFADKPPRGEKRGEPKPPAGQPAN